MLKTNSKKAKENIWNYINGYVEIINDEYIAYDPELNYLQNGNKKEIAKTIYHYYEIEKKNNNNLYNARRITDAALFEEWAAGLTMCGLFDYYLYKDDTNPVTILGDILEETETERARFTEDQAAEMLTHLIYREVITNK